MNDPLWNQLDFQLAGRTLNSVRSAGGGPALFMFHGVLRWWQDLLPLAAHLAARYRSTALDHRGHGDSDPAERYLVIDYASDAAAWLRATQEQSVVLYGHSLGAMVAAAVAAECPDLVRGVVLEDPPFHSMGRRIEQSGLLGYFQQIAALVGKRPHAGQLATQLAEVTVSNPITRRTATLGQTRDPAALRFFAASLAQIDPLVLAPIVAGHWLDGYDELRDFAALRCPVLLLQADSATGGMLSDDDVLSLRSVLPELQHVHLPGVGHAMHWQRTQEVANLLFSFVESLEPQPPPE